MATSRQTACIVVTPTIPEKQRPQWESNLKQLQTSLDIPVYEASGEFLQSAIHDAMSEAYHKGATELRVIPLTLFEDPQVSLEIKQASARFRKIRSSVVVSLCGPLGIDERLIPILHDHIFNATEAS